MKKGFVYLLCQGCLVSQANEKQLDSCQLSMTIRLWLRGWGKDRNTDEGWSIVTGDYWALGEKKPTTQKVIITDRNFWKPNKAPKCLSLSLNKEPSGLPEYKHSEWYWSVNVKPMCMISPLTCWSYGNRAITEANKLHAHSVVCAWRWGAPLFRRNSHTVEKQKSGDKCINVCVYTCVCVCVVQQGVLLSVLALSLWGFHSAIWLSAEEVMLK